MPTERSTPGPLRILAIDPGAQELGFAVLETCELLYFGVHTFKPAATEKDLATEGEELISRLIEKYRPHLFVSEKTWYPKSRRLPVLHRFVKRMNRYAAKQGMIVVSHVPARVKEAFAGDRTVSRRAIAEILVRDWFPYLKSYLAIDDDSGQKYWQNAFDAIALGLVGALEVLQANPPAKRESTAEYGASD